MRQLTKIKNPSAVTDEIPTEPGWYWWTPHETEPAQLVHVIEDQEGPGLAIDMWDYALDELEGL